MSKQDRRTLFNLKKHELCDVPEFTLKDRESIYTYTHTYVKCFSLLDWKIYNTPKVFEV